MRWRRDWSARPPRPKVRRLSADEQKTLLASMTREIARSPVLSGFGVQVRLLRGRFCVERATPSSVEAWGRITPLADDLLLEVERRSWKEVARGSAETLIGVIAGDARGTFHGLGSLDHLLRQAGQGLTRLPMKLEDNQFIYTDSGEGCTVQEALFHYFGLPIEIIAQPATWYAYHRTPRIVECAEDRTRVLVRFAATSQSGSFGGTCLYAQRDGSWGAYPTGILFGACSSARKKWLFVEIVLVHDPLPFLSEQRARMAAPVDTECRRQVRHAFRVTVNLPGRFVSSLS
jgi:hypothetical protein